MGEKEGGGKGGRGGHRPFAGTGSVGSHGC